MTYNSVLHQPVWLAPAKLNLFLHITGQRADGFHELQTVFQFLDVADVLRFAPRADGMLHRVTEVPGVPEADDLIIRAARLLQTETGCTQGADIHIEKHLPMGGGLGGSSSDAATTLVALNKLWQLGLDEDRLAALGLQLGADVPVFVRGRAAWAEGVGEKLTPMTLLEPWYVVLVPEEHVCTAELFSSPQLTRNARPLKIRDSLARLAADQGKDGHLESGFSGIHGNAFTNVFEPVVRATYAEIDAALMELQKFASARLTGTGGCVFAAFAEERQAREVAEQLQNRWQTIVAAACNRSPLFASAGQV